EGRIINATVRRSPSGKYFISILIETEVEPLPKTNQSTGIDVGITDFATLPDQPPLENPRFLRRLEKKLEKEQRILSRRYEQAKKDKKPLHEAKNYQKQRVKVALIHERIKNQRTDYLHKASYNIVKNHDIIGI